MIIPELIENAVLTHAEKPTHGSDYTDGVYTFFAAAKAGGVLPVKLKVKEYTYEGQLLPKNIRDYFGSNPGNYASSYDTVVLEVEEIEESSSGSARDTVKHDIAPGPDELSTITVAEMLDLVKGEAEKYIPQKESTKFSLRDPEYRKAQKAMEQENAKLREDVERLKELVKLQRTVTDGTKFTKTSVEAAAATLMEKAGAKGKKAELVPLLNDVYEYIARNQELTWEGVAERADKAVEWLMEHVKQSQGVDAYAGEILRESMEQKLRQEVYDSYLAKRKLISISKHEGKGHYKNNVYTMLSLDNPEVYRDLNSDDEELPLPEDIDRRRGAAVSPVSAFAEIMELQSHREPLGHGKPLWAKGKKYRIFELLRDSLSWVENKAGERKGA